MKSKPKICADFLDIDNHGRLMLRCKDTYKNIKENIVDQNITLYSGIPVTFWTDDLDDQGNDNNLLFDGYMIQDENDEWKGIYNQDEYRHESDDRRAAENTPH